MMLILKKKCIFEENQEKAVATDSGVHLFMYNSIFNVSNFKMYGFQQENVFCIVLERGLFFLMLKVALSVLRAPFKWSTANHIKKGQKFPFRYL